MKFGKVLFVFFTVLTAFTLQPNTSYACCTKGCQCEDPFLATPDLDAGVVVSGASGVIIPTASKDSDNVPFHTAGDLKIKYVKMGLKITSTQGNIRIQTVNGELFLKASKAAADVASVAEPAKKKSLLLAKSKTGIVLLDQDMKVFETPSAGTLNQGNSCADSCKKTCEGDGVPDQDKCTSTCVSHCGK